MRGWKQINLGETATFYNGYAFKPNDWSTSGKEIIRIQNLTKGASQINFFEGELHDKYKVRTGDILISWSGSLGVYEWEREDAWLNQHLFKVVFDKEELNKTFFKYLITVALKEMESMVHGATMKHITKQKFDAFRIFLPPLEQQKKIAAILDAADAYRQKTKALIAKYDELTQSLFLDMFGDPVKNEKGWEVIKLGKVCGVGSSKRVFVDELVEEGIPFYRGTEVGKLGEGKAITPSLFIKKEHYEILKEHRGVPKQGDLLMPSICPDGRIWVVDNDVEFYFKDGRVLWIEVNSKTMNSTYLKYHLKGSFYANYNNIASGTTFAELKIVALKNLDVFYPDLKLQNKFAERVQAIELQKAQAQASLEKAEELFNSLLQRAFKGELV